MERVANDCQNKKILRFMYLWNYFVWICFSTNNYFVYKKVTFTLFLAYFLECIIEITILVNFQRFQMLVNNIGTVFINRRKTILIRIRFFLAYLNIYDSGRKYEKMYVIKQTKNRKNCSCFSLTFSLFGSKIKKKIS